MQVLDSIFYIAVLIMSVVVHEYAHGYIAYRYGDSTAHLSGRLTLNPIKHLDLMGSIIIPLLLVLSNASFLFGWAKPVPYNPDNLKNGKRGVIAVALAGVVANLTIAVIFGLLIRVGPMLGIDPLSASEVAPFYKICISIVLINTVLAIFNLIPIPPLDGSKILFELLPIRLRNIQDTLEKFGLPILIIFIIFIWPYISPVITMLFSFFTGLS